MVNNTTENNVVTISGKIVSELVFSHQIYGEGFYSFNLEVPRLSNSSDIIPVTISERLITDCKMDIGKFIEAEGQFRSYNSLNSGGSKLLLTVFIREFVFLEDEKSIKNPNQVVLNGFVCKKPIYRTTPFGREITDILLAVNRAYNKSDYIPCIAWGRNAKYSESFKIGENIKVWGRIQSRQYQKKLDNGEVINKTAYEISISKMEITKDKDLQDSGFNTLDENEQLDT